MCRGHPGNISKPSKKPRKVVASVVGKPAAAAAAASLSAAAVAAGKAGAAEARQKAAEAVEAEPKPAEAATQPQQPAEEPDQPAGPMVSKVEAAIKHAVKRCVLCSWLTLLVLLRGR